MLMLALSPAAQATHPHPRVTKVQAGLQRGVWMYGFEALDPVIRTLDPVTRTTGRANHICLDHGKMHLAEVFIAPAGFIYQEAGIL